MAGMQEPAARQTGLPELENDMMILESFVRHFARPALVAAVLLAAGAGLAGAQTSTGTIRGEITDESGAPVAGANIRARNIASGVERSATSNDRGGYTLAGLVPAVYDVSVRRIGSRPQANRVQVQIGQTLTLNFSLATSAI